jgi:hypothetical protein
MSIPASAIVQVNPGVISAGGSALDLTGVIVTNSTAVPIGAVSAFPSQAAVAAFFGPTSTEATLAANYFLGYDNSTKKPGTVSFAQYPATTVPGYLRGGSVASMTLAQLQALTGVLTIVQDGTSKTSSAIVLTGATSFSNAATLIQAGFASTPPAVTYDAQRAAFVITSPTTGAASSISFATGSLSTGLKLTQAAGAVTSAGSIAASAVSFMDTVVAQTRNFATFMTTFEPLLADKISFATWSNNQNQRFLYVMWDTDVNATLSNVTTSAGYVIDANQFDGTYPAYNTAAYAAMIMGSIASLDFTRFNGRATMAFRSQSGFTPTVTDYTTSVNLANNSYNFYGAYATSSQNFNFSYPGQVTGKWLWADSYVQQIKLNADLQQSIISLLVGVGSVPYNPAGYALIEAACNTPIAAALNFGTIRTGVTLSALQIAELQNAAGIDISQSLTTKGYYLQVLDPGAQVRAARGSPQCTLWYMDGQSVQQVNLASIVVQ